jgi:hypothetical protein
MATSFDRWEKDPFFRAAEEVQESADRCVALPSMPSSVSPFSFFLAAPSSFLRIPC